MRLAKLIAVVVIVALFIQGCPKSKEQSSDMKITKESFGKTADGQAVDIYTIENANGMKAKITNYGAIVTELWVPDKDGKIADVVLGYDSLDDYIEATPYFGAIVGRYGNRIAKGKFMLNGTEYTLATNNDENHLHGGDVGFDKKVWGVAEVKSTNSVGIMLTYVSKDMEEGYPGTLMSMVTYALTNDNELKISYEATTDKDTVINLTHHGYFNLAGHNSGDILGHEVLMTADNMTPVDAGLITTGEIKAVAGTPWDFTEVHTIGERIKDVQGGYDHNYVLNNQDGSLALAVTVSEPTSGRVMEVLTTEPGMQFYTGNFLDGSNVGKGGAVYNLNNGFCLESQHYPDSPNKPEFPSCVLKTDDTYTQTTIYKFTTK